MITFEAHGPIWLILLSAGMPGPVNLLHCDLSTRVVGVSMHRTGDVRPTTIADIKFSADADEWERNRVRELLKWGEFCWARNGCVVGKTYDPPPPPMRCQEKVPTS